jgi:hypothetical protein
MPWGDEEMEASNQGRKETGNGRLIAVVTFPFGTNLPFSIHWGKGNVLTSKQPHEGSGPFKMQCEIYVFDI